MSAVDDAKLACTVGAMGTVGLYSTLKNKTVSFAVKCRLGRAILCRPQAFPLPTFYSQSAVFRCFCAMLSDWKRNDVTEPDVAELWMALDEFQRTSAESPRVFIFDKASFVKAVLSCLSRASKALENGRSPSPDTAAYLLPMANCVNFVRSRQELSCVLKSNVAMLFDFLVVLVELVLKLSRQESSSSHGPHHTLFATYLRTCIGSMQDFLLLKVFWGQRRQLFSQFCQKMLCNCVSLFDELCYSGDQSVDAAIAADVVQQFVTLVLLNTSTPEDFALFFQRRDSNAADKSDSDSSNIYVKAFFQTLREMNAVTTRPSEQGLSRPSPFLRFFPRFLSFCKPHFKAALSNEPLLLMKIAKFATDIAMGCSSDAVFESKPKLTSKSELEPKPELESAPVPTSETESVGPGGDSSTLPISFLADVFHAIKEQGLYTAVEDKDGVYLSWMAMLNSALIKRLRSEHFATVCDILGSLLFIHPTLVMDSCSSLVSAIHQCLENRSKVSVATGREFLTNLIVMYGKVRQVNTLIRTYISLIVDDIRFMVLDFEVAAFATVSMSLPAEELVEALNNISAAIRNVLSYRGSEMSPKAMQLALMLTALSKEASSFGTVEVIDVVWSDVYRVGAKIRKKCKLDESWFISLQLVYRTLLYSLFTSRGIHDDDPKYNSLRQVLQNHCNSPLSPVFRFTFSLYLSYVSQDEEEVDWGAVLPAFLDFAESHHCDEHRLCASICPVRDMLTFLLGFGDWIVQELDPKDQVRAYTFVCREAFQFKNEYLTNFLKDTATWEGREESSLGALLASFCCFCAGHVRNVFADSLDERELQLLEKAAGLCTADAATDSSCFLQVFSEIDSRCSDATAGASAHIQETYDLATVRRILEALLVVPVEFLPTRLQTASVAFFSTLLRVLCLGIVDGDVPESLTESIRRCCVLLLALLENSNVFAAIEPSVQLLTSLMRLLFYRAALSKNDWLLFAARCIVSRCVSVVPQRCPFTIFQPCLTYLASCASDGRDDDCNRELLMDTLHQIACLKETRPSAAVSDDVLSTLDSVLCRLHDAWKREPSVDLFFRCFLPCVDFWLLLSEEQVEGGRYACAQLQDSLCSEYFRCLPDTSLAMFFKSARHTAEFVFATVDTQEKYGDAFAEAFCRGPKQLDINGFSYDAGDFRLMVDMIGQLNEDQLKVLFSDCDEDSLLWKVYVTFLTVKAMPAARKQHLINSTQTSFISYLIQDFFSGLPVVQMLHREAVHFLNYTLRLATALVRDRSLYLRKKQIISTALALAADVPFDAEYDDGDDDGFCARFQAVRLLLGSCFSHSAKLILLNMHVIVELLQEIMRASAELCAQSQSEEKLEKYLRCVYDLSNLYILLFKSKDSFAHFACYVVAEFVRLCCMSDVHSLWKKEMKPAIVFLLSVCDPISMAFLKSNFEPVENDMFELLLVDCNADRNRRRALGMSASVAYVG